MNNLPKHIAMIMDGNGRWATRQGLPRVEGHRAGAETVDRIVEMFLEDFDNYCAGRPLKRQVDRDKGY